MELRFRNLQQPVMTNGSRLCENPIDAMILLLNRRGK
jgi:hypothetical protein